MADAIVDTGSNSNGTNTVLSTSPLPPTPAILNGDDGLMPAVAASRQVAPSDNVTYPDSALGDLAARSGFLCFFIVVGFLGNCLLLTTLIRSSRLRRKVIYLFVVYLAVINVVECLVNLPVVLGATVAEQWAYGDDVCRLNAFSIQLTSQALLLGLCMMACDRMLAVTNPVAYPSRLSISKAAILIVVCVCASCGLTVPILTPTIPVQPFAARYLCSVGSQASFLYVILTSALGYMLPLLVILGTYVAVARVAIRSKLQQRNANPSQVYSNVGAAAEQQLWREISAAKYVLLLFVLWCMFQGPYMLLSFTEEFRNSDGIRISQAALEFTFPWEMSLAFTWMKFSYVTFLPVATFCCRKEVWQKFKNILLCRKSNLVNDASPHDTPTSPRKTDSVDRKKVDSLGKVPVLFATENGLHFQTYSKSPTHEVSESQMYASDLTGTLTKSEIVTARKCDVAGSQLLQQGDQDDTSDYDSSEDTDPMSDSEASDNGDDSRTSGSGRHQTDPPPEEHEHNLSDGRSEELPDIKHNVFDSGVDTIYNTDERKKTHTKVEEFRHQSSNDSEDPPPAPVESGTVVDDTDEPADASRCRTSSDSGRGSPEADKKPESWNDEEQDQDTNPNQTIAPEPSETQTEVSVDNVDNIEHNNVEHKPRTRKKKKKREKRREKSKREPPPVYIPQFNDGVEGLPNLPDVFRDKSHAPKLNIDHPNLSKKPPPRLKPIANKPETVEMGPIYHSNTVLPEVQPPANGRRKRTESESSSKSDPRGIDCDINNSNNVEMRPNRSARERRRRRTASEGRNSDQNTDGDHPRSHSGSLDRRSLDSERPRRSKSKSNKSEAQQNAQSVPRRKASSRASHQRRLTNDSQTALLGGSGSSVELGELKRQSQTSLSECAMGVGEGVA